MSEPGASRPEIGRRVDAAGVGTNYLEAGSDGPAIVMIHGSGPGVTAYANWRLTMPALAERGHVYAPDMAGFGFSDKPGGYGMELWTRQLIGFMDALGLDKVSLVGNSFGGGLAIAAAVAHPNRFERLVLMGPMGVSFPITEGLDRVWGYQPSTENMRRVLDVFAFNRDLLSDDLAESRYRASIEPGMQEAFGSMFPAPRQDSVEMMATPEDQIRGITQETLIVHGRDDQVIPLDNSLRLVKLIDHAQLHVFGRCGHWVQIEWAPVFNKLLADFLVPQ